ncbi:MAG: DUF262 domain-containing protein, partial [Gammaproteobacteria bacterium]|nr:DUF262 domain-containing protein [Gammaproteobacteria bacterium]
MSHIECGNCSAKELFSGQVGFGSESAFALHIPDYQRPYCWGPVQLSALLADLDQHFSRQTQHSYYLGSIILHRCTKTQQLNIIDGQQRLTSLALLFPEQHWPNLKYRSPTSHKNIAAAHKFLCAHKGRHEQDLTERLLEEINFTWVITHSEDDAYQFFETQNTGGVRLNGVDIIKAHHLRALGKKQDEYAERWENMDKHRDADSDKGNLSFVVDRLLRGRYWSNLHPNKIPPYRDARRVKQEIIREFSELTQKHTAEDVAYCLSTNPSSCATKEDKHYSLRQPLNDGVNTINYLDYFCALWVELFHSDKPSNPRFYEFYHWLKTVKGTLYLRRLYESALLLYVAQFPDSRTDEPKLYQAALWLFRVIYSLRATNPVAVRENSVPSFLETNPVLD